MVARENAAAVLLNLSTAGDEERGVIGTAAMPSLVKLLEEGSPRGKRDAAGAIFNLCLKSDFQLMAIKAGVVNPLMSKVNDASSGMMNEARSTLALISKRKEGTIAIDQANPIPVLVDIIRT